MRRSVPVSPSNMENRDSTDRNSRNRAASEGLSDADEEGTPTTRRSGRPPPHPARWSAGRATADRGWALGKGRWSAALGGLRNRQEGDRLRGLPQFAIRKDGANGNGQYRGLRLLLESASGVRHPPPQVTYNGWPLYRYSPDNEPIDANGQAPAATWWWSTPTENRSCNDRQSGYPPLVPILQLTATSPFT